MSFRWITPFGHHFPFQHHCRNCGKIVCNSCSKNRYLIQHIATTPSRVCDACFIFLTNKTNSQRGSNELDESSDSDSESREKGLDRNRESGKSLEDLNNFDQVRAS